MITLILFDAIHLSMITAGGKVFHQIVEIPFIHVELLSISLCDQTLPVTFSSLSFPSLNFTTRDFAATTRICYVYTGRFAIVEPVAWLITYIMHMQAAFSKCWNT